MMKENGQDRLVFYGNLARHILGYPKKNMDHAREELGHYFKLVPNDL